MNADFTPKEFMKDATGYAKAVHIEFENLHPFLDGNGRIGRILYNLHRGRLKYPPHTIHEGEEQLRYYNWWKNDDEWLEKALEKLAKQKTDAIKDIQKIL